MKWKLIERKYALRSTTKKKLNVPDKGALSIGKGQIYLVLYEYYVGSYQANIS